MPNALQITDPRGDPDNPLVRGSPTWANAYSQTTDALGTWLAEQRAKSANMGLWNDQTGMPTGKGLVNAGQQYGNALLMGTTAPGVRAYHGSPHSFERFDTSKIGTGEGAQAYGHGLYFAEREGVAKGYRDALTQDSGAVTYQTPHRDARLDNSSRTHERFLADRFRANNADVDATVAHLQRDLEANPGDQTIIKALELARAPDSALALKGVNPGSMYEVNIGADPETFLHWDRPLSEQHPVVQDALSRLNVKVKGAPPDSPFYSTEKGHEIYQILSEAMHTGPRPEGGGWTMVTPERYTDPAAAAAALRDAGIPGIRYLDQGSRGAGEGSHNYVVFDAATIDILRKYGLAGLMAGGAATGAVSGDNQ